MYMMLMFYFFAYLETNFQRFLNCFMSILQIGQLTYILDDVASKESLLTWIVLRSIRL